MMKFAVLGVGFGIATPSEAFIRPYSSKVAPISSWMAFGSAGQRNEVGNTGWPGWTVSKLTLLSKIVPRPHGGSARKVAIVGIDDRCRPPVPR